METLAVATTIAVNSGQKTHAGTASLEAWMRLLFQKPWRDVLQCFLLGFLILLNLHIMVG
jgi:hypothetical protein